MSRITEYLRTVIPGATKAVVSYYWLYLAAIVLPQVLTQLQAIKAGTVDLGTPLDVGIVVIPIIISAVGGTLAYIDRQGK